MTEIIHLISGPRNISTALMYSFGERRDTAIVDEPFYGYYLSAFAADHPGRAEIIASLPTDPQEVITHILYKKRPERFLFVKNMAHHMVGYDYSYARQVRNIFLIRDPLRLIASFAKVIDHPVAEDIGLEKEVSLYRELNENTLFSPVVLDSGELLKDPEKILVQLCEKIDIPFDRAMLSWPQGPRKEDGIWAKYWYNSVHRSTCFVPQQPEYPELRADLIPLYEKVKPHYDFLFEKALKA